MLTSLLNAVTFNWGGYFETIFGDNKEAIAAANQVFTTVETILWIIIGIVGLAAVVYAVYLGIQLARAEDQSKRDEAKKHLITVIIAVGVTLALILVFNTFLPALLSAFNIKDSAGEFEDTTTLITPIVSLLK